MKINGFDWIIQHFYIKSELKLIFEIISQSYMFINSIIFLLLIPSIISSYIVKKIRNYTFFINSERLVIINYLKLDDLDEKTLLLL